MSLASRSVGRATAAALFVTLALPMGAAASSKKAVPVDRLLPQDTLMAFWVDSGKAYTESTQDMPLVKTWNSEEVQTFAKQPVAAAKEAIGKLTETLRQMEGFENLNLDLDQLLAGDYGRVFFAVTHVAMPGQDRAAPDIGLVIGVEPQEGAPDWIQLIQDVIQTVALEEEGQNVTFVRNTGTGANAQDAESALAEPGYFEAHIDGVPSSTFGLPVLFGRVGDLQLFSLSKETMSGVMSRAEGQSMEDSLLANPDYATCKRRVNINSDAAVDVYMNIGSILRTASEGIKLGMVMDGKSEHLPLVDRILESSGLLNLQGMLLSSLNQDGVALMRSFAGMTGVPEGLMKISPMIPLDLGVLDLVPENAVSFQCFQLDLASTYDFAMDMVRDIDEEVYFQAEGMIQGFGVAIGGPDKPLNLRDDVLANMGPQFLLMQPQASNPMMPSYILLVKSANGAEASAAMKALLEYGSMMSGGEFTLKTSTYKETEIVQVNAGPEMGLPVSPAFAVIDGTLCISLNVGDLKRHVRRAQKPGASIKDSEDFQRFYSTVPEGAELFSLAYTDVKRAMEDGYNSVAMALPMVTMAADIDLPFDMALLPTSETITENLFGSLSYAVADQDGALQTAYGPIGIETYFAIGAMAGAAAGIGLTVREQQMEDLHPSAVPSAPSRVSESIPEDEVRYDLSNLKAGVTIFKLQNSALPADLAQLLEPSESYPQGCLGRDALPVDPWGNPYQYRVTDSGYVLWSAGPDGTDGSGDDIKVEKK